MTNIATKDSIQLRIAELWRYPVKSMAGEQLTEAKLGPLGLPGDRRFALRDLESGKIISAKQPRLATALLGCSARYVDEPGAAEQNDHGVVAVTVGGREYDTSEPGPLNEALTQLLGRAVRIEAATTKDEVYESYWPEIDGLALSNVTTDLPIAMSTNKGTFNDLAALHLVATSSVDHLCTLLPGSVITNRRFRPNILVSNTPTSGFVENDWAMKSATIADTGISFGLASPRCVMTTVAQADLPRDPAVLQTLARENKLEFAGFGNFACLGVYAEVTQGGMIRIGDTIEM
jgi:uncharacterized protein